MGIYANLAVEQSCEPAFFSTLDDAAKDFFKRLNCTRPDQERAVREYCRTSHAKTGRGYRVAHLWWDMQQTV
jgi:hypothetical protein